MKKDGWLIALGVASPVVYVIIARFFGAEGFPLDDAWIHQVYARNLGWYGQWAFTLGQPSAGSTSPLWTFLLAIGYALRIDYALWTIAINAILLGVLTLLVAQVANSRYVALLIPLEWHLVWAAASGMETILFCVLIVAAWFFATRSPFVCGVMIGLAVWTRPEGATLLPFCAWSLWAADGGGIRFLKRLGVMIAGAALIVIPYLLFNVSLSGQIFPNTFFAKQSEYAILTQLPLWQRMFNIFSVPFIGVLVLLLPQIFLSKRWSMLAWVCLFLFLYVLRLPVTYQHGRYLIPVIPILIVMGGDGMMWVQLKAKAAWRRLLSRAWLAAVGVVAAAFWMIGLNALIADVRLINNEMVRVAKWVNDNVPRGSSVAAHDIGALGYFADVRLIDLAGLVSPDVIPVMGDEARLWAFIRERNAQYVINYPGWCPNFLSSESLTPIFQSGALCHPPNPNFYMTVYKVR
jgi:hypothetical protein